MLSNYHILIVITILIKLVLGEVKINIGPNAPYIDETLPEPSHTFETYQTWGIQPPTTRNSNYKSSQYNNNKNEQNSSLPMEIAPLYPGYGTHYAYIYVGTPPKRQSVIIDTG